MPGCINNCYLFWETHSLEHVDPHTQIKIEKELKKARSGESYDVSMLSKLVNKRCLGNYLKKGKKLKNKCCHFWELPEELPLKDRIEILHYRKNKKWKILTLILGIINIILLCLSVYISVQKSQLTDLRTKNTSLTSEITDLQNQVNSKTSSIKILQDDMDKLNSKNAQMNQQISRLEAQISKYQNDLSIKTKKNTQK